MEQAASRMLYLERQNSSVTTVRTSTPTKPKLLRNTLEQKPTLDYGTAGEPKCNLNCNFEELDNVLGQYYCMSSRKQS
jgi:hypothetical protein